eukprot:scaffold7051_cov47-Phaeocystis_antarctica.AAC.3
MAIRTMARLLLRRAQQRRHLVAARLGLVQRDVLRPARQDVDALGPWTVARGVSISRRSSSSLAISVAISAVSLMTPLMTSLISLISVVLLGDEAERDRLVEDVRSGPREHGHLSRP